LSNLEVSCVVPVSTNMIPNLIQNLNRRKSQLEMIMLTKFI